MRRLIFALYAIAFALVAAACSRPTVPAPVHHLDGRWGGWDANYRMGVDEALLERNHLVTGEATVGACLNWDASTDKPKCFIVGVWDVAATFAVSGTFFNPDLDARFTHTYLQPWAFTARLVRDTLLVAKLEAGLGVGDTVTLHRRPRDAPGFRALRWVSPGEFMTLIRIRDSVAFRRVT